MSAPQLDKEIKSADDVLDILNSVDDESVEEEEEVVEEDKKEEVVEAETEEASEDKEKELEDEKIKLAEEEEEIEVHAPPRQAEIEKKYPKIFKEFPYLQNVLARDKQFAEIVGSVDDAKNLIDQSKTLKNFEEHIFSGKTEDILKIVKDTDSKAFNKIVEDYLPTLARVDRDAYMEVIGNVGKHMIMSLTNDGKRSKNDSLLEAAKTLNEFLFGTDEFTPPKKKEAEVKDDSVEKERQEFFRERFEVVRDELQTKIDNVLRATIGEYIDPKGQMSDYVRRNATRDALGILTKNIGNDKDFRSHLDRLWENAFSNKLSKNSVDNIRKAYLGKAKTLLPSAIKKARAEAITTKEVTTGKENQEKVVRKSSGGRPASNSGKMEMKKGESVLDFFNRE